jgi:hypothetical protein
VKALVIYESMYGNTHLIAEAIAEGLRTYADTALAPVDKVDEALVGDLDLIVVGGPTHAHGMSRASTRKGAVTAAEKPGSDLALDPDAEGPGLREWFSAPLRIPAHAAAFDTRMDGPVAFTGRASKGIARKLQHHGTTLVSDPESFLVTKQNHLEPDEEVRARAWGVDLGRVMGQIASTPAT